MSEKDPGAGKTEETWRPFKPDELKSEEENKADAKEHWHRTMAPIRSEGTEEEIRADQERYAEQERYNNLSTKDKLALDPSVSGERLRHARDVAGAVGSVVGESASERVRVAQANVRAAGMAVGVLAEHVEAKAGERWDARKAAKAAHRAEVEAEAEADEAKATGVPEKHDAPIEPDFRDRIEKYSMQLDQEKVTAKVRGVKISAVEIDHPSDALAEAICKEFDMTESEVWRKESDKSQPKIWKGLLHAASTPKRAVVAAWEHSRNLKSTDVSGHSRSQRFMLAADKETVMELVYLRRPRGIIGKGPQGVEVLDSMRLIHAENGAYDSDGNATKEFREFQKLDRPKSPDWQPITDVAQPDRGRGDVAPVAPGLSEEYKELAYQLRKLPPRRGASQVTRAESKSKKAPAATPGPTPGFEQERSVQKGADVSASRSNLPEIDSHDTKLGQRGSNSPETSSVGDGEPSKIETTVGLPRKAGEVPGAVIQDATDLLDAAAQNKPHGNGELAPVAHGNSVPAPDVSSPQPRTPITPVESRTVDSVSQAARLNPPNGRKLNTRRAFRPEGTVAEASAPQELSVSGTGEKKSDADAAYLKLEDSARKINPNSGSPGSGPLTDEYVKQLAHVAYEPAALEALRRQIRKRTRESLRDEGIFGSKSGEPDAIKNAAEISIENREAKQLKIVNSRAEALDSSRRTAKAKLRWGDLDDKTIDDQSAERAGSAGNASRGKTRGAINQFDTYESSDSDVRERAMRDSTRSATETPQANEGESYSIEPQTEPHDPSLDGAIALRAIRGWEEYVQARDALVVEAMSSGYIVKDEGASLGVRRGADPESVAFIHELMRRNAPTSHSRNKVISAPSAQTDSSASIVEPSYETSDESTEVDSGEQERVIGNIEALAARSDIDETQRETELAYLLRDAIDAKALRVNKSARLGVESTGMPESSEYVKRLQEAFPAPTVRAERVETKLEATPADEKLLGGSELDAVVASMALELNEVRGIGDAKARRARVRRLSQMAQDEGLADLDNGILSPKGDPGSELRDMSEKFVEAVEEVKSNKRLEAEEE